MMQVSVEAVLNKLTSEVAAARQQHNTAKVREHLAAIRALCDLVLEEQQEAQIAPAAMLEQRPIHTAPSFSPAPVPLKEEGANGGSLLDF
jgi:hypothetical protein